MAVDFTRFSKKKLSDFLLVKTTNNKIRRREQEKIDAGPRGDLYSFYSC